MSEIERNRYLNYIAKGQTEIRNALSTCNEIIIENTMDKYTGPGTGLSFRNGFLVPNYNIYSGTDGELLIREGDKVYV